MSCACTLYVPVLSASLLPAAKCFPPDPDPSSRLGNLLGLLEYRASGSSFPQLLFEGMSAWLSFLKDLFFNKVSRACLGFFFLSTN
jgi:hypothetical protein